MMGKWLKCILLIAFIIVFCPSCKLIKNHLHDQDSNLVGNDKLQEEPIIDNSKSNHDPNSMYFETCASLIETDDEPHQL